MSPRLSTSPDDKCPVRWDNHREHPAAHFGDHNCRYVAGHNGPHKCKTFGCEIRPA
ncbi:hypothetical protein GCM10010413_49870 [Promicromonospora sukumoe]|uniref:Uncharacterized protein n=1 Tax=Promicromonospora sukumoe TaxID=88382 RepID=A0A7W3JAP3_9MICO|nr:hypothetical protein [Promicromonospora sukumoe]